MVAITSSGFGSGLDINGIVSQVLAAEAQGPTNRLDLREATLQVRLSAYGTMKSAIAQFQSSLASLQDISAYRAKSTRVGDSDVLTASVSSSAVAGSYDIDVTKLAKHHRLSTEDPEGNINLQLKEVTDVLGTGKLTFKFGTYDKDDNSFTQNSEKPSKTITITDGSLQGIRDAVNDADIGVTATIIFDGNYQRLTFSSDDSGADNSMQIIVTDDGDDDNTDAAGLSLLAYDAATGGTKQMLKNVEAQDSEFTVNGLEIKSETNSIKDAIDGVTLNLKEVGNSSLDVNTDSKTALTAIKGFVANYNGLIGTINNLTSYNVETGKAAQLNGDAIIRGLETQLKRFLGDPVNSIAGAFSFLSDVGITSNAKTGLLEIDDSKLDSAINDNLDDVIGLFAAFGRPTDNYISFDSSTEKTQEGSYAISIDSFATKGSLAGSAVANLTITSGANDKISIKLDGVTAEITLTAGVYSASALVAELQSQINAVKVFRDSGSAVVVSESAGVLSITSNRYGSASKIEFTGGNGSTGLIGASATNTAGTDVVGSIGGVAATGSGQFLTGAGNALGLKIQVVDGGNPGDRGTISFARGFADRFDSFVGNLLGNEGVFESTIGSLKSRIEGIDDDRKTLARRLATIEKRVRSQFIALDLLITRLQNTGNFLNAQLEALPEIIVRKRK